VGDDVNKEKRMHQVTAQATTSPRWHLGQCAAGILLAAGTLVGAIGLFGVPVAGATGGTDRYAVSTTGKTTGTCTTPSTACTLTYALSSAASTDTILLEAGTYKGHFTIPALTGLTVGPKTPGTPVTLTGETSGTVLTVDGGARATVEGLKITGGKTPSTRTGGGIFNSGTLTVESSTVSGNSAIDGGGILNAYVTTVESSTISGNSATLGGGIFSRGTTTTVESSTIWGNSARTGGGIVSFGTTTTVESSTVSKNSAGIGGGGIYNFAGGDITVESSTISGNTAEKGGNIDNVTGRTALAASIVAGSATHGGDCAALSGIQNDGYNVAGEAGCGFSATTSTTATSHSVVDPAIDSYLGTLAYNGGPTETIPLLSSPTSPGAPDPAYEVIPGTFDLPSGPPACSMADQRGEPRSAPCDVGAYEATYSDISTTVTVVGPTTSVTPGSSATFTATLSPTTDDRGTISFYETGSSTPLTCTATKSHPFDGASATCVVSFSTPGTYAVTAEYSGDSVFAKSQMSAPWMLGVTTNPTATTLSASTTSPSLGAPVTFTATVSPTQTGSDLGKVTFSTTGSPLTCTATKSQPFNGASATCVVSFSEAGIYTVGAEYSGDAHYRGSASRVVAVSVAIPNPGYRIAASTGGVFSFTARFSGSMGGTHLNAPVVGMATDPMTGGYWLVAATGGVFSFTAPFYGSMGGKPLNAPVVGMAATPTGTGYWLVAATGGVFTFGTARFSGSLGGEALASPITSITADPYSGGYWLLAGDGAIVGFGAPSDGTAAGLVASDRAVGIAAG